MFYKKYLRTTCKLSKTAKNIVKKQVSKTKSSPLKKILLTK